jgi:hypothetical protein
VAGVVQLVKYVDVARSRPLEAMAYSLLAEHQAMDWQLGAGRGGLESGVGRIGIPSFFKDRPGTGLTTELAIANVVPKAGFTDFVVYVYDQNGLITDFCQKLNAASTEYIDVDAHMGMLPVGFKGSAVISAVYWSHHVFDSAGGFERNLVGLAAAKVERSGTVLGVDAPGDESAAMEGYPILGGFAFAGPPASCPGIPGGGQGGSGPRPLPTSGAPPTALPPPAPPPPLRAPSG